MSADLRRTGLEDAVWRLKCTNHLMFHTCLGAGLVLISFAGGDEKVSETLDAGYRSHSP